MPKEEKGYWFSTENGTHIHAEEGESKESAMKKKFSKFGKKEETKKDSTFEEINEKRMSGKAKKHDYSEIFDEDYQRSWGTPDFKDENDIKTLNDIVEKAMEYDGEEGAIDISNNAMDRISELVKFSPEEQDKLASGTGEEIMDILRSKESKKEDDELQPSGYIDDADKVALVPDLINKGYSSDEAHDILFEARDEIVKSGKDVNYKSLKEYTDKKQPKYQSINDTESYIKSLKENADKKNLSFERTLLNDIKSNPEKYNRFTINGSTYVRNGLGFDKYKDGKHISTGTFNSVATDIANSYEEENLKSTESKSGKVEPSKLAKSIKTVDDVKSVFGKYLNEKDIKKLDNSKNLYIEISKQYDGDDNFQIIDDERIKKGHNYGNGTLKDFQEYMKNNKDYAHFIKLR